MEYQTNSMGSSGPSAGTTVDDEKPVTNVPNSPKKSDAAASTATKIEREGAAKISEGSGGDDVEEDEKPVAVKSDPKNHMLVDHSYTNYAILSEKDLRLLDENSADFPEPKNEEERDVIEKLRSMTCTYGPMKKSAGGVVQPFPGKLMEVLERTDIVDVISWMPHGRAFIVKKPKLFAVDVLPRFFKQTKYLSFTRQLNLWGFKRITKGLDGGAYYHELFLRGRPYLAMRMKRHKVKGTGIKLTPNPNEEPLFYRDYPYMEQLDETRFVVPLPPLPYDRPDQETSLNHTMSPSRSSVKEPSLHLGQFPPFSHAAAVQNMMGTHHPFLASSQNGSLLGEMPSFLSNHPRRFPRESYGGLPGMPHGGPFSQSQGTLLGGTASGGYPTLGTPRNYDNVLFAPGISWGSVATLGRRVNDPIQDELIAMIRNRQSQTTSATEMFDFQNLTSDRLLMERLRDLDRAAKLKREQQDISMLGKGASKGPSTLAGGVHGLNSAFSGPSISNGLDNGPLDRYCQMSLQPGAMGLSNLYQGAFAQAAAGPVTGNIEEEQQTVESSVKKALREANHFEELAMAQRAKATNIALAGALQLSSIGAKGASPAPPQAATPTAAGAGEDAHKRAKSEPKENQYAGQFSAV